MSVKLGVRKKKVAGRPDKIADPRRFVLKLALDWANDPNPKRQIRESLVVRGYTRRTAENLIIAATRDPRINRLPERERNVIFRILRGRK